MLSQILVGIGLLLWALGYRKVNFQDAHGLALDKAFVRPPFILYLVCGQPKAQDIPQGVMSLSALIAQMEGILMIGFGIATYLTANRDVLLQSFALFVGTVIICYLGFRMYKRNPYQKE